MNAYRLPAESCHFKHTNNVQNVVQSVFDPETLKTNWDDETFCTISDSKYNTKTSSKKPCVYSGDSGGPMVCYENNKNAYINGIVSYSAKESSKDGQTGCIMEDYWVDVRKLREWIDPLLVNIK